MLAPAASVVHNATWIASVSTQGPDTSAATTSGIRHFTTTVASAAFVSVLLQS